jgi:hypothetical protein
MTSTTYLAFQIHLREHIPDFSFHLKKHSSRRTEGHKKPLTYSWQRPCAEDTQELPREMSSSDSHSLPERANVPSSSTPIVYSEAFQPEISIGAVGHLKSHDYDKAHRRKASIPTWQFHRRIHSRSKFMNGLHHDRMFVLPNTIFPNNFRKHFDSPWSVFLLI